MSGWLESPLIIVAGIAVVASAIAIGRWSMSVDNDRKKFRKFMKSVQGEITGIRSEITGIRSEVTEIRSEVRKILMRLFSASVSSGSPIQLTDLGRDISKTLQVHEWAENVAVKVGEQVRDKQPYKIQEFCFDYVKTEFKPDNELETRIGMCAFENGIDQDGVLDVFALELRDILLKNIWPISKQ